jgi:phage-related protein
MNLYWCETEDHDEDWFVVASSAREARRFHEVAEGYGRGEVQATLVCRIPPTLIPQTKGWPDHDLLRALGGVFVSEGAPRVVWIKSLPRHEQKTIGADIKVVQFGWPVGMPLVRKLETDLWEVRSTLGNCIARVLFTVDSGLMTLLHGFIKQSQKTPPEDLALARKRLRQWRS